MDIVGISLISLTTESNRVKVLWRTWLRNIASSYEPPQKVQSFDVKALFLPYRLKILQSSLAVIHKLVYKAFHANDCNRFF